MKTIAGIFLVICLLSFCPLSFAELSNHDIASVSSQKLKTDVVLLAVPIALRSFTPGTAVDALEKSPEEMGPGWKVVVFRIERVARGEFKVLKGKADPSAWEQAQDAAKDKNILKLVTMDFQRPDESPAQKPCFSMAVTDPFASFGIKEGEMLSKQRFRIALALVQKNPSSYVMVKYDKA